MRCDARVLLLPPLALLLVTASCAPAPRIRSFRIEPPARCGPGEAELRWEATGKARLEADPPIADLGAVPASGSRIVSVRETTVFKLSVSDAAEPTFERAEIHVISPEISEPFQATALDCQDGTLVATASVPDSEWPAAIVVTSVRSDEVRPIRVSHQGRTEVLEPQVASEAFRGMPYRGDWTLEMDGTGDGCADAPASLFLELSLGCTR